MGTKYAKETRLATAIITGIVFSVIPGTFTVAFYSQIAAVLLKRKRKVGRNINLVWAFGMSCLFCFLSNVISATALIYDFLVFTYIPMYEVYNYQFYTNLAYRQLSDYSTVLNSVFNPFLLIIILQNYRKPFNKFIDKLIHKCNVNHTVQVL